MDWSWLYAVGGVALNFLVLYFWKPWASAYAGEKAKNFARKEDLDGILAEVRAVTITQKEIELRLSGDLWNRQVLWNQKRDFYVDSLRVACEYRFACISAIDSLTNGLPLATETAKMTTTLDELNRLYALAIVFASDDCTSVLRDFQTRGVASSEELTEERFLADLHSVNILLADLTRVARADLGVNQRLADAR